MGVGLCGKVLVMIHQASWRGAWGQPYTRACLGEVWGCGYDVGGEGEGGDNRDCWWWWWWW